jgi:uncharacterized protein YbaR (Trm112 family)
MLDVLVCPFDKESELELFELKTRPIGSNIPKIEKDKSLYENKAKDIIPNTNNEYEELVIEDGMLFCNTCLRFFPIIEEIPIILPDELRDKDTDLKVLEKWSNLLPDKIVKKSLPWHL